MLAAALPMQTNIWVTAARGVFESTRISSETSLQRILQRNVSVREDKTHPSAPSTPPFTDRSCFIDSSVFSQHLARGNHAHQPHHLTVLLLERDTINLPPAFSWPSERIALHTLSREGVIGLNAMP